MLPRPSHWLPAGLALILLAGLALRLGMLARDARFHPDEALFAAQARMVAGGDLLLRATDLDKPPLPFYATALALTAFGDGERAARVPNAAFSLLTVAALATLAHALYHDPAVTLLAAGLLACSPFDLAYAATVFTDVQATCWLVIAAALAARDRWGWSGVAAALALAAKQNAAFLLPLVAALGGLAQVSGAWGGRDAVRRAGRWLAPIGIGLALLVVWDLARAPRSFLALGFARNNPGRLIRADEVGPRLEAWAGWLGVAAGGAWLGGALLIAIVGWLWIGWRRGGRAAALDWALAGYAVTYLGWHWLVAFNTYDRYLHPLIPFLALLAARAVAGWWRRAGAQPAVLGAVAAALVIGLSAPVARTLRGESALGGDRTAGAGIVRLADTLNTTLAGAVVYDHWLGWELAYYLGEAPRVTVRWMPLPEALTDEAQEATEVRYFAARDPAEAAPWVAILRRAGVGVETAYQDAAAGYVVYALHPQGQASD